MELHDVVMPAAEVYDMTEKKGWWEMMDAVFQRFDRQAMTNVKLAAKGRLLKGALSTEQIQCEHPFRAISLGANQYASWTKCAKCQARLTYHHGPGPHPDRLKMMKDKLDLKAEQKYVKIEQDPEAKASVKLEKVEVSDLELQRQAEELKQQAETLRQLKKAVRKVETSSEATPGSSTADMSQLTGALEALVQTQKESQMTMVQGFQSILSTLTAAASSTSR
jgi:hypothetical protein